MRYLKFILWSTLLHFSCKGNVDTPPTKHVEDSTYNENVFIETPSLKRVKGNSIQVDPAVLNQLGVTPEQFIADLKMANIKSVHYFVAGNWDGRRDDQLLKPEYLKALKDNNIAVWLMLLGNCIYGNADLPKEWQMEFLSPYPGGIKFYSLHRPEFIDWQINRLNKIIDNYDFVGFEFAESYFPEWKTIATNGFYGDVSLYARSKFTKEYLKLSNATPYSFDVIRTDNSLYEKWMTFRADAVVNFNKRIKDAIKARNPNLMFASWGMGVRNGTLAEIREHFGLDMLRIVKEVQPDVFVLQTAAQDWGDPNLQSDYLKEYGHLFTNVKTANPKVAISIQADIVSLGYSNSKVDKRMPEWWLKFFDLSLQSGYYTNTAYEYAFAKKEGIWPMENLKDVEPRKLYSEPSLTAKEIADGVVPLSIIKEQDKNWKQAYTEHGLGWIYID